MKTHRTSFIARIVSLALVILILSSAVLTGCGGGKVVKIGFVGQLTGSGAWVGQVAELAIKDRVEEINKAGGINGYQIKLISYDSRSEVADAVQATKRLIDQDKVSAIIGPEWTAAGIPIAAIADASKVPVIATTASNIKVTLDDAGKARPYMFRVCFIDPYQGFALADYAYKDLGKKKVAFITDVASAYSVGIQDYLRGPL